jgi:hypothetical protein
MPLLQMPCPVAGSLSATGHFLDRNGQSAYNARKEVALLRTRRAFATRLSHFCDKLPLDLSSRTPATSAVVLRMWWRAFREFAEMKTLLDQAREYVVSAREKLAELETSGVQSVCKAHDITREFSHGVTATTGFLRTALDRCAHELYDRCVSPKPASKPNIYFPIAFPTMTAANFAAYANGKIPGLNTSRPDLVTLLASFQAFSSPAQNWLAEFATLCNENKHHQDDPSMAVTFTNVLVGPCAYQFTSCANVQMRECRAQGGMIHFLDMDEHGNVVRFEADPGVDLRVEDHACIRFNAVNEEVIPFLRRAIYGVEAIVDGISKRI